MTHGSLFSGVGGFEIAAEKAGFENIFHCEINPFGSKVLNYHWPKAIHYADITTTDFTIWRNRIDVLTGGWPCTNNSKADQTSDQKQKGLDGEKSGLWFHFERAICEIRPTFIIGENVPDVLTINGGGDFNRIMSGLAGMGYNAQWGVLRASDIGAPHHRARLYIVAYTSGIGFPALKSIWGDARAKVENKKITGMFNGASISIVGSWKSEPDILRVDDGLPNRSHRFEALGNAVVPQISYEIFKAIKQSIYASNQTAQNQKQ